ncbi:MAG: hypothetical protein AABN33_18225 [Acidobacteriota bacterium]
MSDTRKLVKISISFTVDGSESNGLSNFHNRCGAFLEGLKEDFGPSIEDFQGEVDVTGNETCFGELRSGTRSP